MKRLAALFLAASLLLPACGDGETPGGGGANPLATKEGRAKAALEVLFAAVRQGDAAEAARHIVYRGADKARKWKSVCDYSQDEDKPHVDRLMARIGPWIGDDAVEFVEFRSETESEGEWLVWKVKGSGATAWFACLDIDGTVALGDVDKE